MEQFSLEEYLKNPNRRVITRRGGLNVRIICTDRMDIDYPVVALVQGHLSESLYSYTKEGLHVPDRESPNDLFFAAPEPKTKMVGWINLYKDADGDTVMGNNLYETEEEALVNRATGLTCLGTSKIEWEE